MRRDRDDRGPGDVRRHVSCIGLSDEDGSVVVNAQGAFSAAG